ncbi:helix-turn-helix domain-containing protein [Paraglaciecola aquimarina]|uniref:Helix-turn-helix domain-containing protein n=1 Tax=Paraglaciecola algarum TaxID=3050085 RepID=A0ABS9D892_9ALTE|nr:helix-turn-helix domain-containing protein [Paraglaciecola sp. G1-23]
MFSNKSRELPFIFLAGFLVAHSFIALHELVLWGATFRQWVLSVSPNIFFTFNFSSWIDGPFLYLFIISYFSSGFRIQKQHFWHLIPAALFLIYMWFAFWQLPIDIKNELIVSHEIAYSGHYVTVDLLNKLQRLSYILLSIYYVRVHTSISFSDWQRDWVTFILYAFGFVLLWEFLLTSLKVYDLAYSINHDWLELIGLTGYYSTFALVNLVLYVMVNAAVNAGGISKPKTIEPINMVVVEKIEQAMQQDKLYLNPVISFERLAEQLDVPVKDLSSAINRHFNINFYEYINGYRIREAKEQLLNPVNSHKTITDIFYQAGFNSKSVYNTLFKKKYNMTPSAYRKKHLSTAK